MFRAYLDVPHRGETVRNQGNQDRSNTIPAFFAKASRACPPFCIHSMQAAPGVVTVGEVEALTFLTEYLLPGVGLLTDARTPDWYRKGTIPGAINIPRTLLPKAGPEDPTFLKVMQNPGVRPGGGKANMSLLDSIKSILGAGKPGGGWSFATARDLLLFCNDPWCDQSPGRSKALTRPSIRQSAYATTAAGCKCGIRSASLRSKGRECGPPRVVK